MKNLDTTRSFLSVTLGSPSSGLQLLPNTPIKPMRIEAALSFELFAGSRRERFRAQSRSHKTWVDPHENISVRSLPEMRLPWSNPQDQ